ncbi:glutathione transferase GstA [Erwinia tracheiphila]|uniref:Glutathione S-transferase n=1 Tax=Erwinia tracheiphila TaxID=65700 RepID=A0A0M2KBQ1_9GAMM|nr:glutathione transferase GstA [Erwinia tracheiphila]AXF75937.1 glutathione transferase GstA [Erwinia tracheiphila]EOS96841.1 glutathionine S-transferase [Erwinia tracheiphila PSU-1]KKF34712.1 glutathione S-transferase [Erwinia tracheiphila]UIA85403.1 glutathione transferase GstA [Erwinia tracheiphila]UIA86396.1 glutathione transferase GstA [Erwinia tracheiphila]
MKLYYKPGACSLSPHIVLRETGIDFTLIKVDLQNKKTEQEEDFLLVNPKGQVPTLQFDDGSILTEGVAIVQYLADCKPDRQLLAPVGSPARYHTIEWLNFIATELHKGFAPLFRPDTPEELKAGLRNQLAQKFSWVEDQLQDKQWLTGSHFTVADAYLFTVLRWAAVVGLDLSAHTSLNTWSDRVAERPAVSEALKAEGI